MIYNYYDFEENAPKDQFVEEEIKTLLEPIKSEKIIVTANMYNEKTLMDAEERERKEEQLIIWHSVKNEELNIILALNLLEKKK